MWVQSNIFHLLFNGAVRIFWGRCVKGIMAVGSGCCGFVLCVIKPGDVVTDSGRNGWLVETRA